jgi:glycosyltransferase involved in cell wall biosynthesis
MATHLLSLVVPVYNEENSIDIFMEEINKVLTRIDMEKEIIFINDGSRDTTFSVLLDLQKKDRRVKIINLSRNFGKDIALTAGLDATSGDAVVPMDVDLQDPPELILDFVSEWKKGADVVYGTRRFRTTDSAFKRFSSGYFYRVFNMLSNFPIPHNTGDYRLMDKKVIDVIRQMPERDRFMKGIFAWVGFTTKKVEYDRPSRAKGETKWNYFKLFRFAVDGILSFSSWPLRIWTIIGLTVASLSFLYGFWLIIRTVFFGVDVKGYPSLIVSVLFMGSLNLSGIGMLGEYLARVYNEAKRRPLYITKDKIGF